jgi:hypothetical protein
MMKKILVLAVTALLSLPLFAQDNNVLRHYSLSLGIGTTGVTADLGTMLGNYVGIRGGIDYMPKIEYKTDLNLTMVKQNESGVVTSLPQTVDVKGKLDNITGHALFDVYPFKERGFHLTFGAYFCGKEDIVTVFNEDEGSLMKVADFNARRGEYADVPLSYGLLAAKLGDYNIMPDDNGNANAYIKVKKFRPYVGLGFGRAVPRESRLNCQFDMGVQFWDKPVVYNGVNGEVFTSDGAKGEDGGILKVISKFSVYPVISIRLAGRLF